MKRVSLGPEEICSFVIGDACGDVYNPFHEWKVIFPPVPKPEVPEPKVPTVRTICTCVISIHVNVSNFEINLSCRKEHQHSKFCTCRILIMTHIIKKEQMQTAMNHFAVD